MRAASAAGISLPSRYRVEGFIAAGGMAGVWGARDTMLDRPVAIKVLAEHLSADEDAKVRFQREARTAARISEHPHVVTIYDVGEHDGRAFIVMEWLRGGSVADWISRRGRPDRATALRWLREAASALDAAHERGIVHRDIKPGNFLLDDNGRLAVGDFGIARLADADNITQPGVVLGTAAYLSPEQAVGEPATTASDRYALAVVAFELLTGAKPFAADNFAAQARQQVEEDPPLASSVDPGLPRAADGVLARGMAKDPAGRWETCAAFVEALEPALHDDAAVTASTVRMPPRSEPERQRPAAATAVPPGGADVPRAPGGTHGRRPSPGRFAAPLMVLLALVAGVAFLATRAEDDPQQGDRAGRGEQQQPAGGGGASDDATAREDAGAQDGAGEEDRPAEPQPAEQDEPAQDQPASDQQAAAGGGDPAQLNARGFELMERGDFQAALPLLQRAVERCGDSDALDPCGYAHFNLGQTLNRLGRPEEAIPHLEARLERWGYDQRETVERELEAAYAAAGREGGGKGKGKTKGNGKGRGNG